MTATSTRVPSWDEAALVRGSQGLPWWSAVLLAMGLSATGVFLDLHRLDTLGRLFQVAYFAGCVLAVVFVQRKGLFGPMVQPPLILGITVPAVVIAEGAPTSGGLAGRALDVGEPLINGFPTMALTTGVVLAIGLYRLATQRAPEDAKATPRAQRERAVPEPDPKPKPTTRERLAELATDRSADRDRLPERTSVRPVATRTAGTTGRARGGARAAGARAAGATPPPDVTRTTPVSRQNPPRNPPRQAPAPSGGRTTTPPRPAQTPPRAPGPQHGGQPRNGQNGQPLPAEQPRQPDVPVTRTRRSSA